MIRSQIARSVAALALAGACSTASATWSILIADTRTGEIALASATCVQSIDLQSNTPVLVVGVGAATAQSFVEARGLNRTFVRDRLLEGVGPEQILTLLEGFDNGHQNRQYGILDVQGGTATFSGSNNSAWAGGVTGRIEQGRPGPEDDIVYAVQGNILVGPEPVLMAEQAILTTPGDLGEKITAAMEAARAQGGDGRCSCTTGGPTSCDIPPPEPFKSADVGYILWARAGDREGCPGRYRLGATEPVAFAMGDFDGDGVQTLAALPRTTGRVALYEPIVSDATTQVGLMPMGTVQAINANGSDIAAGDVTGDGLEDLVVAVRGVNPRLAVLAADPNVEGGFGEPLVTTLPAIATQVMLVDIDGADGLDVVALMPDASGGQAMLSNTDGSLGVGVAFDLGGDYGRGDHVGAGAIAIPRATGATHNAGIALVTFDAVGSASLSDGPAFDPDADPVVLRVLEITPDGVPDFAVADDADDQLLVFASDGGSHIRTDVLLDGSPIDLGIADVDSDGNVDMLAMTGSNSSSVRMIRNAGNLGVFASQVDRLDGEGTRLFGADLNGDGFGEVITGVRSIRAMQVLGNDRGRLDFGEGCATGDYFLELNVSGNRAAPDPVFTLQDEYDIWRASKTGIPDAVLSGFDGPTRVEVGTSSTLTLRVRDIDGLDATESRVVDAHPLSAGVQVTEIREVSPSLFEIDVVGGASPADVPVRVTLTRRSKVVTLMPDPMVRVYDNLADVNLDGLTNATDINAFVKLYLAGDAAADIDGDGDITEADISAFINAFANIG